MNNQQGNVQQGAQQGQVSRLRSSYPGAEQDADL